MAAFNLSCAGCVFGKIKDDTEPIANTANDLKVGLFRHGTNSLWWRCIFPD